MTNQEHNGWTNYETWLTGLWIDNEEGSNKYWNAKAREVYGNAVATAHQTRAESAVTDLAEMLKADHTDNVPLRTGLYHDLLIAALEAVNWYEIANHYIDECESEEQI